MGISLVFSMISTDSNDLDFLLHLGNFHMYCDHCLIFRLSVIICVPTVSLIIFMLLMYVDNNLFAVRSFDNLYLNLVLVYLGGFCLTSFNLVKAF